MGVSVMAFAKDKRKVSALFWTVARCDLLPVWHVTDYFVWRRYEPKHAWEVFLPSIQFIVKELDRPFIEAGFKVTLYVVIDCKNKEVMLWLTPLLYGDGKDAEAMAVAEICV